MPKKQNEIRYSEQLRLPAYEMDYTTPNICAVCGDPSVGEYRITLERHVETPLGDQRAKKEPVTMKLCRKHADQLQPPKKAPRTTKKIDPAPGQLDLF